MKKDFYEILGISKNADAAEIKKAYRKQAIAHHPDKNPGDKSAEEKFKLAAEAYEILSDPQKKAKYDQYGHQAFDGGGFGGGSNFGGGTSYGGGYSGGGYAGGYKPRGDWASNKAAPQAPPALVPKATDSHGIRSGMQVFHAKFGEGAVLSLEGVGLDARAQISFNRHGVKWLALSVAKLTVI